LAVWLLPKLWHAIKGIIATIRGWFGSKAETIETGGAANNIVENVSESKSKKTGDE